MTTVMTARTRRYILSSFGLLSLLVLVLGFWSIEAYRVSGVGYSEPVDWAKLFAAFTGVDPLQFAKMKLKPADWVAIPGMVFLGVFPLVTAARVPLPVMLGYLNLLLVSGGWIGVLLILGLPLALDATGEFFAEGLPGFYGSGVLSVGIGLWAIHRLIERKRETILAQRMMFRSHDRETEDDRRLSGHGR